MKEASGEWTERAPRGASEALEGFVSAGCEAVSWPILQPAGLFLDRLGEGVRRRLYLVRGPGGEEHCLCPDLTIPAAVTYVTRRGGEGEVRYAYGAPAFRRSGAVGGRGSVGGSEGGEEGVRRLWQAGVELFGGSDAEAAEAEATGLLWGALQARGEKELRLCVSDTGLLRILLEKSEEAAPWREWAMERLGESGTARALERWSRANESEGVGRRAGLMAAYGALDERGAEELTRDILALAGGVGGGEERYGRSVKEMARRLRGQASLRASWEGLEGLRGLASGGETTMEEAMKSASSLGVGEEWLGRMERRLGLLEGMGVGMGEILFSPTPFGGLDYYGGFRFEIRARGKLAAAGGRYDKLLTSLGAPKGARGVGGAMRFGEGE